MIRLIETSGRRSPEISELLADTEKDLETIPKHHTGDMVYVIESGTWYILNSEKEWKPLAEDLDFKIN
jgi:hypothetical protein